MRDGRAFLAVLAAGVMAFLAASALPASQAWASELPVKAIWLKDCPDGLSAGEPFVAASGEFEVDLLFMAAGPVKDFKVLALEFKDIDEAGKPVFDVKELRCLDELTPEHPLAVTTVFYGDLPNNGISYVDGEGKTRNFSVGISGEDGSLTLNEF